MDGYLLWVSGGNITSNQTTGGFRGQSSLPVQLEAIGSVRREADVTDRLNAQLARVLLSANASGLPSTIYARDQQLPEYLAGVTIKTN